MNWYMDALNKYAVFSGRARRKEYWYFVLLNFIVSIALSIIDLIIGTFSHEAGIGLLGGIFALIMLIPRLAVTARRLHDTGRSGWWCLIALIPLIGSITLLVFTVQDSEPGQNQYGVNPKEASTSS